MNRCALSLALCKVATVFYNAGIVFGNGVSVIANSSNPPGHSPGAGEAGNFRESRRPLFLLALAYLVFVVYGSLVPLHFHGRPLAQAWQSFLNIPYLDLGMDSRADWVANGVLYAPLSFLASAALAPRQGAASGRVARGGIIFFGCVLVALAVEFAQLFFPPRTVSLNDILAELIGAAAGVVLWSLARGWVGATLVELQAGGRNMLAGALTLYLAGYLAASFFPYDFVISSAELAAKLANHRDSLILSPESCPGALRCVAKLAAEVVAMVPMGVLAGVWLKRGGLFPVLLLGAGLGLTIEAGQLLLVSGIAQGASVFTRMAGLAVGWMLYVKTDAAVLARLQPHLRAGVVVAIPLYALGLALLTGWFTGEWIGVESGLERIEGLHFLPFYYHYYTSESVAVASALRNMALYLPVGLGCCAWAAHKPGGIYTVNSLAAGTLGGLAAVIVESSKLFLAAQRPDPTNVLLGAVASALACAVAVRLTRWYGRIQGN